MSEEQCKIFFFLHLQICPIDIDGMYGIFFAERQGFYTNNLKIVA